MKPVFGWKTGWLWGGLVLVSFAIVTSGQVKFPDGDGKQLVQEVCGTYCHGAEGWSELRLSKEDWDPLVRDMSGRGEARSEAELKRMIQYLGKFFGPEAEPEKVSVNKANAKELETALAFSSKEAESIVEYRERNGNFKSLDDLKKVPDLDAKKLEEKKDRLVF